MSIVPLVSAVIPLVLMIGVGIVGLPACGWAAGRLQGAGLMKPAQAVQLPE